MYKTIIYYLSLLVFISCSSRSNDAASLRYFQAQISDRMSHIRTLDPRLDVNAIHAKVNDFELLSKDIENLQASVHLANRFFREKAALYSMDESAFVKLDTRMHTDHIALLLRQNELSLLNQIVFRLDSSSGYLYTAH